MYEEGSWDYALIPVRDIYQRLMHSNGIVPIEEGNWIQQHNVEFEYLSLLGLPDEYVSTVDSAPGSVVARTSVTMVFLDPNQRNTRPPEELSGIVRETETLQSIRGMSGGPVIGYATRGDGIRYWIAAIQRRWNPQTREITAYRVPSIVEHFRQNHPTQPQDN